MPEEVRGAQEDVKLKVSLDEKDANSGFRRLQQRFSMLAATATRRLAQAGFGGLAAISAGMAAPALGDLYTVARGYTATFGQEFSQAIGLRGRSAAIQADLAAQQRTMQAFGLAGAQAGPAQIESVFNAFQRIERMRSQGRLRIEEATRHRIGDVGEKLEKAAETFNTATQQFKELINSMFQR